MSAPILPAVREHPIIFSGPMVRAILAGKKTQTRRVVKPQPPDWLAQHLDTGFRVVRHLHGNLFGAMAGSGDVLACRSEDAIRCPYGAPGDTLWVREQFAMPRRTTNGGRESQLVPDHDVGGVHYLADGEAPAGYRSRPSIHMPRWASRLTLLVKSVRVERLQEISEEDAIAEGVEQLGFYEYLDRKCRNGGLPSGINTDPPYVSDFRRGWDSINGARAPWSSNPYVWVLEFERVCG